MNDTSVATAQPNLGYADVRLSWCRFALLAFLRRWGVYLLVLGAVIGAGAVGALQIIGAVAAWLVLPLFYASSQPVWLIPAVAAQALVGVGCTWGARAMLWSPAWAEAERALPIPPGQLRHSDVLVVSLVQLPLMLLYAVGTTALLGHGPSWLRPTRGLAIVSLLIACAASVVLGVMLLQRWRRSGLAQTSGKAAAVSLDAKAPAETARDRPRTLHWPMALGWLSLWRGPARRVGRALWLGVAAMCLPGLGMGMGVGSDRWDAASAAGWWLAGFAALSLLVVTRIDSLARDQFAGLIEACAGLPLQPRGLRRARAGLPLLPLLPGTAALMIGLPPTGVRPGVLAAYLAWCLAANLVEVTAVRGDAGAKSSRWLFSLVLGLALASEVMT